MMNKRAQVTLYILIAIVLVSAIVGIALFKDKIFSTINPINDPKNYLSSCVLDSIKNSEKSIFSSNGFQEKGFTNFVLYRQEKVPYLCISSEFYKSCTPQEPMFLEKQRRIIENKAAVDLKSCMKALKSDLNKKGYFVKETSTKVLVSLIKDNIIASVETDLAATKDGVSMMFNELETVYSSKLFNVLKLEQTIVNYESTLCEFSIMNWMSNDPEILIKRDSLSDQTKIYTLQERVSENKIKFAIKTCTLPAGL